MSLARRLGDSTEPCTRPQHVSPVALSLAIMFMRSLIASTSEHLMAKHPNKHIREAVLYAQRRGWRFVKAGGHAHVWGELYCPLASREGCIVRVYSTPRNPENHAKRIRSELEKCPHTQ